MIVFARSSFLRGNEKMEEKKHLYLLWTNGDPITAENMVFMYAANSLFHGWWDEVTLIIWGSPVKLVAEDKHIQKMLQDAKEAGVHVSACKTCSDQLGVCEILENQGIEVKHWGQKLTELLKSNEKLLTI